MKLFILALALTTAVFGQSTPDNTNVARPLIVSDSINLNSLKNTIYPAKDGVLHVMPHKQELKFQLRIPATEKVDKKSEEYFKFWNDTTMEAFQWIDEPTVTNETLKCLRGFFKN